MPATIDATVSGASANSYSTLAVANAHFEGHVNGSAWFAQGEDRRNTTLITASRDIDRLHYIGDRASAAQALRWPRTGLTDDEGQTVASDSIPSFVLGALYERALELAGTPTLAGPGSALERVKSIRIAGDISIEPEPSAGKTGLNARAMQYLLPWLAPRGRVEFA